MKFIPITSLFGCILLVTLLDANIVYAQVGTKINSNNLSEGVTRSVKQKRIVTYNDV
ncbi:MAG: hypothetical protein LBU65_05255 [Planctomycetaceae bacterium]|jgi:hypothetical protein|nr:hypothetical protein [Planctomycetaceae bacterium]